MGELTLVFLAVEFPHNTQDMKFSFIISQVKDKISVTGIISRQDLRLARFWQSRESWHGNQQYTSAIATGEIEPSISRLVALLVVIHYCRLDFDFLTSTLPKLRN